MDREIPIGMVRKKRIRRVVIAATAVIAVVVIFSGFRALLSPTLERGQILTSVAEVGRIEATVTAAGVVVPEFEQALTSPIATTIEAVHLRSGDSVRTGESILQLDTAQVQVSYRNLSDELEIQRSKTEQIILGLERKRADLQASHDIKVLSLQFVASKHDRAKHLFEIGGITRTDLDLAALDLEIAKRESEQLADQVRTQEASCEAAKRELDLQLNVQENQLNEIRRQLGKAAACAGRGGTVTWVNDNIGASVNAGEVIARVGDLSSFEVEATISDVHVGKLALGGAVNVRVRETILRGHVSAIRPAVQNGVVTFIVALDDNSNESLHPNLRTDVFVVTSTVDNVVRVKNGPFYNGSLDQEVFTIDGNMAVKHVVDIGVSNFDWVQIKSGIEPGAEVIVSDTKKYRHLDEVAIR